MTPIEFWDYFCSKVDQVNGGSPPEKPMTVESVLGLESRIKDILKAKGKEI